MIGRLLALGLFVTLPVWAHDGDDKDKDDRIVVCHQCPPAPACVCPAIPACPPAPVYRPAWQMRDGTFKYKGDKRLVPVR